MNGAERIAKMTGLPREVVSHLPRVVWYGNGRVLIEQHRGIITYQKDMICFQTTLGLLTIRGESLEMVKYTWQDAVVRGDILSLSYLEKGGK